MLHNRKLSSGNLQEELEALGIRQDAAGIQRMGSADMSKQVMTSGVRPIDEERSPLSRPLNESAGQAGGHDPLDGPYVTRELLGRIVNLPLDALSEDDLDELIGAFADKVLPEGDQEIADLSEAVMGQLLEKRVAIRMQAGKKVHTQRTSAGKKRKDKIRRRKPQTKKLAKKLAKKEARGIIDKGKLKTAKKQGKTRKDIQMAAKGRLKKKNTRKEDMSLANELQSLLDESVDRGEFAETQDRIFRIFDLISEMTEDDVTPVLQEAWNSFKEAITEDTDADSFLEAAKPCLALIKRCLEEFDAHEAYNGDDDDDDDDDEDDDDDKKKKAKKGKKCESEGND